MQMIFNIIILICAIPLAIFCIKAALDRSKSNKTSLFGSFNAEYRKDNLGKMTPSALEGLDEAKKHKRSNRS